MIEHRQGDEQDRVVAVYAGSLRSARSGWYAWYRPEVLWSVYRMRNAFARNLKGSIWQDLSKATICDVGCGTGSWLRFMIDCGASPQHLHGIDLIPERVIEAIARLPETASIQVGSAAELPYSDKSFDVITVNTVFSSIIDPAIRLAVAADIWRTLRPGGVAHIIDFRWSDPRNPDTVAIRSAELWRLFPQGRHMRRSVLLPPPISRRLAPWCMPLVGVMEWVLPFLRGHVATAIWKD